MSRSLVVVQQYLSWKGHYKQYFENLFDTKYNYFYASNNHQNYINATWIKSDFDAEAPLTIKSKIKGRFLDSYNVFKSLCKTDAGVIHLIEFEPLAYLLFSHKLSNNRKLIITIHSSDRLYFSSWINNKLSGFQRWLLELALRKAVNSGAYIVTHYECHRESIIDIVGNKFKEQVSVINYPAPSPESSKPKLFNNLNSPKFLIYGQIREDKGIYEFLSDRATERLNITIAGKIVDRRILQFTERENLEIIDKFLTNEEISQLVDEHDFMLLPYPAAYTNGAGTFKDSLAKAMPVVCSSIPIFQEIINEHEVGLMFQNPEDIEKIITDISSESYRLMSEKCLEYAYTYNWEYMKKSYFSLYERLRRLN